MIAEYKSFIVVQLTGKRVNGRQEIIPDWFKEKDENIEQNEKEFDAEVETKRQELLKKLESMKKYKQD